jgi:probable aminopeptidase NPEPL1
MMLILGRALFIVMVAGPKSARPDDIHVLYSGKTVEINNTDAGL